MRVYVQLRAGDVIIFEFRDESEQNKFVADLVEDKTDRLYKDYLEGKLNQRSD